MLFYLFLLISLRKLMKNRTLHSQALGIYLKKSLMYFN